MTPNLVDKIMAYEQGEMDQEQTLQFFQELIDTGLAFKFQGHYGRTAVRLIKAGLVRPGRENK